MDKTRFYGKPMHRADDSSDDERDDLEDSVYETESSELESDYHISNSVQSFGEMNTTKDDDDILKMRTKLINHKERYKMSG